MVGQTPVPDWLKTDEILSHFGAKRGLARDKYREYVREATDAPTIWENEGAEHFGDGRICRSANGSCDRQKHNQRDPQGATVSRTTDFETAL